MEFTTLTGFGYFKDATGKIVSKFILPVGVHPIGAGYNAFDVENETALSSIIYVPADKTKEEKRNDILSALSSLDLKSIRPLSEGDTARVASLNAQKVSLRAELAAL